MAVVDDDPRLLESLEDLLESAGYSVRTFRSARSFLDDETALSRTDCLITDIGMPVIDGFELEKLVKEARPELPVFLITGRHEIADQQRAIAQGNRFFRKPFDGQALLAAIGQALRSVEGGEVTCPTSSQGSSRNVSRARTEAAPKRTQPLVMIVDDDERIREALQELMLSVGIDSACFASTRELLDADLPDRPGCLILDVRMPGASGLDLQHHLAASGNAKPIIFLTGHGDIPMTVQAMKAGAVDFLTKPVRDQTLLDAVTAGHREGCCAAGDSSRSSGNMWSGSRR